MHASASKNLPVVALRCGKTTKRTLLAHQIRKISENNAQEITTRKAVTRRKNKIGERKRNAATFIKNLVGHRPDSPSNVQ
ncbi:hypothetical protein SY86_17450 [Erwinia tracheiphila]|uniref:Uncharacterized protein n=1 Tax=Erwinia tracheiphila TaxID=65700 RepID=A0A0M2KHT6_9GAMM|nr:hypothetical protein AV903_18460 [Erwinia tracheiphila]EOS94490.1 hypothetical protein ETR_13353 [Erwinia tracheiphila PSU-1]KKF36808.1 hypothetical protein SY86_17450 [Erwinia tracheiphila]